MVSDSELTIQDITNDNNWMLNLSGSYNASFMSDDGKLDDTIMLKDVKPLHDDGNFDDIILVKDGKPIHGGESQSHTIPKPSDDENFEQNTNDEVDDDAEPCLHLNLVEQVVDFVQPNFLPTLPTAKLFGSKIKDYSQDSSASQSLETSSSSEISDGSGSSESSNFSQNSAMVKSTWEIVEAPCQSEVVDVIEGKVSTSIMFSVRKVLINFHMITLEI